MKLNDWIGFGEESNTNEESYTSARIFYRKNEKNISFDFSNSIYELLYTISHSNTY